MSERNKQQLYVEQITLIINGYLQQYHSNSPHLLTVKKEISQFILTIQKEIFNANSEDDIIQIIQQQIHHVLQQIHSLPKKAAYSQSINLQCFEIIPIIELNNPPFLVEKPI